MTTRLISAAFAFVLLAGSAAAVPAAAGAPVEGDALAARVATLVGADSKGILGMTTDSTQKISAPIMHKQTTVRRYVVFQDGIPVAAGIISVVEDGRPYDSAKLAQLTADTDTKIKHGEGFNHQPYVSKFVREYHFASAPCDGCAPGERGLKFDTDLHDDVHIAGLMVVDAERPSRARDFASVPISEPCVERRVDDHVRGRARPAPPPRRRARPLLRTQRLHPRLVHVRRAQHVPQLPERRGSGRGPLALESTRRVRDATRCRAPA